MSGDAIDVADDERFAAALCTLNEKSLEVDALAEIKVFRAILDRDHQQARADCLDANVRELEAKLVLVRNALAEAIGFVEAVAKMRGAQRGGSEIGTLMALADSWRSLVPGLASKK